MTLTRTGSSMILYHLGNPINGQKKLRNYLRELANDQERDAAIRQFRDQIMQLHARVEEMFWKFVKFLDNDIKYSQMTRKEDEGKTINAKQREDRQRTKKHSCGQEIVINK